MMLPPLPRPELPRVDRLMEALNEQLHEVESVKRDTKKLGAETETRIQEFVSKRETIDAAFKDAIRTYKAGESDTVTLTKERATISAELPKIEADIAGQTEIVQQAAIDDLAEAIAPSAKRRVIGLRPGEKTHELLISEHEATQVRELVDRYVIYPSGVRELCGNAVPVDFKYSSDQQHKMTVVEIRKRLQEAGWLKQTN